MRLMGGGVLLAVAVTLSVGASPLVAQDVPSYSRPDAASEALRGKDLPFQLWYDPAKWQVQPQRSNFPLLARAVHKEGHVSGAFVYRDERESIEAIRERAVGELESAFDSHRLEGFSRRSVNGLDVLLMKASAISSDGTEVVVRNYYWQGPEGVADYGLVVNRAKFERFRGDMLDLLNGFRLRKGGSFETSEDSSS